MNRRNISRLLAALISAVLALKASANGFRLADQDAFATARGEAFVATADNPSAIYYNPAGIAQLEGRNVRFGLDRIYYDPSFLPPDTATNRGHIYNSSDKYATVPQVFYTTTPQDLPVPLTFGLGVYSPYGAKISWPEDTGFRAIATKGELTYITINPVIALKVTPHFSIGAGAMVSYADMDLQQGLNADARTNFANLFRFNAQGWGVGYNLGALWRINEHFSLGATFRSFTKIQLNGWTEWEDLNAHLPITYRPAYANFTFPLTAVVGISYRPTPKWNLEFDADYTDWSSLGKITINQSDRVVPVSGTNVNVTLNWQPSWLYEFGITRYLGEHWQVSAGYVYNENSVPDAHYTPIVADLDRHFFSAGAGFRSKHFSLDVAYQFGYGPPRKVTGSVRPLDPNTPVSALASGQTADGTYDFRSHAVMLTLGLHY